MEKEKKEIKISLWTFYVLVAAIVVLIGAVVIGGLNVARQNAEFSGIIFEFGDERETVYNKKYALIADKLWQNIYLEPDSDHRTSFQHEEKLTLANIDNQTKLEVAIHKIIIESGTIKWFLMDKFGIDAKEVEKNVVEVFGENATVAHENIASLGFKYANGKYIETVDNLEIYENNASVYAGPTKAILNDGEIIIYEEYAKKIYNSVTETNTLYATGDNKLKILEYKEEEWSTESPYEKIVMPVYKHTFKENNKGKYYWVSSELVNKDELKIVDNNLNTINTADTQESSNLELGTYLIEMYPVEYNPQEPEMFSGEEEITFYSDNKFAAYVGGGMNLYGTYFATDDGMINCTIKSWTGTFEGSEAEVMNQPTILLRKSNNILEVVQADSTYTIKMTYLDEEDFYDTNSIYPFEKNAQFKLVEK